MWSFHKCFLLLFFQFVLFFDIIEPKKLRENATDIKKCHAPAVRADLRGSTAGTLENRK
jgi:hypothetical protein